MQSAQALQVRLDRPSADKDAQSPKPDLPVECQAHDMAGESVVRECTALPVSGYVFRLARGGLYEWLQGICYGDGITDQHGKEYTIL